MSKNTSDIRNVVGVQFGVLSPEECLKRSVVHVEKANLYENNGDPVLGGLFDPRMGVCDRNKKCKTCELTNTFCPGHYGHIELAKPVF
jgi:DNA-directed RNA polymerase beta' subunit